MVWFYHPEILLTSLHGTPHYRFHLMPSWTKKHEILFSMPLFNQIRCQIKYITLWDRRFNVFMCITTRLGYYNLCIWLCIALKQHWFHGVLTKPSYFYISICISYPNKLMSEWHYRYCLTHWPLGDGAVFFKVIIQNSCLSSCCEISLG